ncbi:MAG TPA: dihydrofolate reductase family protein [Actinocatenispora sp.]
MRKLVVVEFVTLDGVMQGLGSPDEDRDGGFEHGGWGAPYGDEMLGKWAMSGLPDTDAYLLGRRTYEKLAAFWPSQPDDNPMAAHLNRTRKYVATRSPRTFDWANTTALDAGVPDGVAALKDEPGGAIGVLGSGVLVQDLIAQDLVDEYQILLHPLLLGTGRRLFRGYDRPRRLRLVDSLVTTTGVVALTYRPERD